MQHSPQPEAKLLATKDYHVRQDRTTDADVSLLPGPNFDAPSHRHGQEPSCARPKADSSTNKGAKTRSSTQLNCWKWEVIVIVFSVGCLLCILVLATKINRTLLSNWSFILQPGTLISILATACQSSMMLVISEIISQSRWVYFWTHKRRLSELAIFDSASKGPLGAMAFFWPGKSGIRPIIAYGGVFVTITALALGPFTQQIYGTQLEKLPQPEVNSTIPVANVYESGDYRHSILEVLSTSKWSLLTIHDILRSCPNEFGSAQRETQWALLCRVHFTVDGSRLQLCPHLTLVVHPETVPGPNSGPWGSVVAVKTYQAQVLWCMTILACLHQTALCWL